ncbi:transporter substrate-binding protein [Tumidithrix elongata RA019]|uniref:Adenylate cyclase n=1 Tax=Tumidithrix elongata BACA0141 TaxID=2716417 RepID=A0AAW9PWP6_9CYAN|nr:transporter substrate-binding protein [Tumidithrix elongata RA019]
MIQETQSLKSDISERVQVGILHSLSGDMAVRESPLKDAALMAIAEINQAGGVLGKIIEPRVVNGGSYTSQFTFQVKKLLTETPITTIFGGWTSTERKAVLSILEEHNAQLWYPLHYEGLECSPHIFYTGVCPNQQVQPAVSWLLQNQGLRIYLLGSDSVYSRTVNKIIQAQLKQQGATLLKKSHVTKEDLDFSDRIEQIKQLQPDAVISTLLAENSREFYQQYHEAGITAEMIPIVSFCLTEMELQTIPPAAIVGHYASWNYFQTLETPQNQAFIQNFQARYGEDRVVNAAVQSAYAQIYLWKQAVETAQSFDVLSVRQAAYGQTYLAPSGTIQIVPNQHIRSDCHIGKVRSDGQFQIVHTVNAIPPLPWLGVEELNFGASTVVMEMLAETTRGMQLSWQLEKEANELEGMIDRLIHGAKGEGRHQLAPEITRAAMSKLIKAHERLQLAQAELLKVEVELKETNEDLERRVEERTAQLQQLITELQAEAADRLEAEQLLQESQKQLEAIAANVPGVVYRAVLHADGNVSMPYISPRTQDIFGLSSTEVMEHLEWVFDMAHPEDRAALNEIVMRSAEELTPFDHEYRSSSLFPNIKWVRIFSQPHRTENGDVVWDGVIVDITQQKHNEELLRQAEEKYRSIFENAIEGIFQANFDGCYISANPALAEIYGYDSPSELLSCAIDHPSCLFVSADRYRDFAIKINEQGSVTEFEVRVYRKDKSVIWISINASLVRDPNGTPLYYEGIVQDVTERKCVENALKIEQEKSERLLLNILPQQIVQQLKLGSGSIATRFEEVTILFADIVDFSGLAARVPAAELVNLLNQIFSAFDLLADKYGLEKIKTIGDAYMVVGGLPTHHPDHAVLVAEMAIAMQQEIARFHRDDGTPFRLRIGINTGPVVAGVIGIKKFIYDLWGDAVNIASRMESQGLAGSIQVTDCTYRILCDRYVFERRGVIAIKGKGEMITYMLKGKQHTSDEKFLEPPTEKTIQ